MIYVVLLPHMIGSNMIATTMYFPVDLYKKIGQVARSENKAKAQVVRELVGNCIDKEAQKEGNATEVFAEMRKFQFKGGPRDLAKNHDHYAWD